MPAAREMRATADGGLQSGFHVAYDTLSAINLPSEVASRFVDASLSVTAMLRR